MGARNRAKAYVKKWESQGYPKDIPDHAPDVLEREGLAPSYRSIALAILKNDLQLLSLGFSPKQSKWYGVLKRMEIESR